VRLDRELVLAIVFVVPAVAAMRRGLLDQNR
jgi:hypothetical protein